MLLVCYSLLHNQNILLAHWGTSGVDNKTCKKPFKICTEKGAITDLLFTVEVR